MLERLGIAAGLTALVALAHPVAAQDPVSDQVAKGEALFGTKCARCHGASGEGTKKAPPLVGKAALPLAPPAGAKVRTAQFKTAKDVAEFVVAKMPGNKPGSLKPEEYFAILAFDLKANGVALKQPVDMAYASTIVLHP
jgi:mono/diheme cytochrome c family protein